MRPCGECGGVAGMHETDCEEGARELDQEQEQEELDQEQEELDQEQAEDAAIREEVCGRPVVEVDTEARTVRNWLRSSRKERAQ